MLDKDELKQKYKRLYKSIYRDIDRTKKKKAADLIENLAMIRATIDECEDHINSEGLVVKMSQGNYDIDRENPYIKIQDRAQRTYSTLLKQLDDMLPTSKAQEVAKAGDALKAFIASGKPE